MWADCLPWCRREAVSHAEWYPGDGCGTGAQDSLLPLTVCDPAAAQPFLCAVTFPVLPAATSIM